MPLKSTLVLDQGSAGSMAGGPEKYSLRNTYLSAVPGLLFILQVGFTSSYTAPATVDMQQPGSRLRHITADEISWIASLPMISGIFGNAFSGYATHFLGRKAWLLYTSLISVIGWLTMAYAPSVPFLYVGRILCGFACASTIVVVPTYIVEIAPSKVRGQMTTFFHVAVALGIVVVMALGTVLRWSWLAAAGAGIVVAAAGMLLFVPESPPWLAHKGRLLEAKAALQFLRGGGGEEVGNELQEMTESRGETKEVEGFQMKDVVDRSFYKPLLIAVALMFFMTFCGTSTVLAYTVDIFRKAGSSVQPNVASIIIAIVQLLGTLASSILMDLTGRRRLYLVSGVFVTISLVSIGAYSLVVSRNSNIDIQLYGWIPLLCLVIFIFSMALGLGSVPFVMTPEISPLKFRSVIMAVSTLAMSLFAFLVLKMYDSMQGVLGVYGLYWFYGAVSFLSILFGVFVMPETKGMSLQDIQDAMAGKR